MTIAIDSKRLTALRESRAWSQEDLAAASGLSARTVQRLEAGDAPSAETLRALAAAFDLHPNMIRRYHIPKGLVWGLAGGLAGIVIGPAFAFAALWMDAAAGEASGQTLGIYAGVWGAGIGAMCAWAGIMLSRDQVRFRSGNLGHG